MSSLLGLDHAFVGDFGFGRPRRRPTPRQGPGRPQDHGRRDGPAATALSEAATRADPLPTALRSAADAADAGAASTSRLLAKRGRASYVGENARGVTDPGALTVALFFEAAA
ncbi:DAK2 domain-containing protein [Amycolatopsis sp. NPDC047767]|uniref:DAK2 domain-containing protein n=1 Tax=Amycolatopsis sp. NPDC047767 TaxID=3156765 RepID=UPI003454564E